MKKLVTKDKKNRSIIKNLELEHFILKNITYNLNFLKITRWNALYQLTNLPKKSSKTHSVKRCVKTFNRKTFHKLSNFSRTVFLKLIRSGSISGMRKSSW
jgi:ribosomal protein S14